MKVFDIKILIEEDVHRDDANMEKDISRLCQQIEEMLLKQSVYAELAVNPVGFSYNFPIIIQEAL